MEVKCYCWSKAGYKVLQCLFQRQAKSRMVNQQKLTAQTRKLETQFKAALPKILPTTPENSTMQNQKEGLSRIHY
jgi:hypothetical protein